MDAIRSAAAWRQQQGWIAADPSRMLCRRKPRPDRSRALDRGDVEQLVTREDVGLRERTLWRILYDGPTGVRRKPARAGWGCGQRSAGKVVDGGLGVDGGCPRRS